MKTIEDAVLVDPTPALLDEALPMVRESAVSEGGFTSDARDVTQETFADYVRKLTDMAEGRNLPEGYVPMNTFWLRHEGRLIGISRLRLRLVPALRERGGHIGYWIRPSERRRGYGTLLLALTCRQARAKGIRRVLLTCDAGNTGSRRIIEKNGGVPDPADAGKPETETLHYWIDLTEKQ